MEYANNKETPMEKHVKVTIWVAVIILVAGWVYWMYTARYGETTQMLDDGSTMVIASEGNIVSGFPPELIRERDVRVDKSYAIEYVNSNKRLPVARYTSSWTIGENVDAYRAWLEQDGWNITHDADPANAPVTFFYAKKDNTEVNISFIKPDEGSPVEVNVAYVEEAPADKSPATDGN